MAIIDGLVTRQDYELAVDDYVRIQLSNGRLLPRSELMNDKYSLNGKKLTREEISDSIDRLVERGTIRARFDGRYELARE